MGGSWDGEVARLEIPEEKLMTAYEDIAFLFGYIQNWKSTRATFNGKSVPPYRFIFRIWHTVGQCRKDRIYSVDPHYCWSSVDSKGWGCKHLCRIFKYPGGSNKYKTNNRYWYNFGELVDKNTWKINKELILQRLKKEIDDKVLYLCPHFNMEEVERAVQDLPDFIKVDNIHYCHYCTPEYVDGVKRNIPVNIRHVIPPKEIVTMQDIIKDDPGKYRWN